MLHDVGAPDEFPEDRVRLVRAGGRDLGVVRWSGDWYALRNRCPHESGPVCAGTLMPMLVSSDIGTVDVDPSAPVLICPWHQWEFDVRSGRSVTGGEYRVATYGVRVERGRVLVEIP